MRSVLRAAAAIIAIAALLPLAVAAATKPFPGVTGWDHTVGATPSAQTPRAQETWKKSDGEQLTYLADGGLAYDDIVAMVKKNVADNGIKPALDKDRTCEGKRAHEIEMAFGTTVVHQIIVDDSPGVTKLTFSRAQGQSMPAEVTSALTSYCGS
jgi:hypothetical protein